MLRVSVREWLAHVLPPVLALLVALVGLHILMNLVFARVTVTYAVLVLKVAIAEGLAHRLPLNCAASRVLVQAVKS